MCKLTINLPIQGCWIFRIQGGGFDKGEEKNSGRPGLRLPSELCFGTSEIEWSYIMYTFLTLLYSCLLVSFNEAT